MKWIINSEKVRSQAMAALAKISISAPICMELEPWKKKRNIEQNRRLWLLYTAISQQAPAYMDGQYFHPDAWHYEMAGRFLGYEPTPSGKGMPKSTTKLNVSEMAEYQTQVEVYAIEEFNLDLAYDVSA